MLMNHRIESMIDRPMAATTSARRGLSLVELMVCLAILSYLLQLAMPLADNGARRARELEVRESLRQIRHAIDRYHDLALSATPPPEARAGYPPEVQALVRHGLLRRLPVDALTGQADWILVSTTDWPRQRLSSRFVSDGRNVFDVRTRAPGQTLDDVDYADL
jgi:general secretion pathway protein G